jgi:Na+/H+ antiporter NhaD/arsenite permease-like protein
MLRIERLYWGLIVVICVMGAGLYVARSTMTDEEYRLYAGSYETLLLFAALMLLVTGMYQKGLLEHGKEENQKATGH